MSDTTKRTEKHEQARNSLPKELVPIFDDLVADYKFCAIKHHGSPFVSYAVLAEMVKAGWRLSGEPFGEWKKPTESDSDSSNEVGEKQDNTPHDGEL